MRWLIAIGLTFTLAAGAARAATPAEIACASYRSALAGETSAAKRAAMRHSLPSGCEAKTQPLKAPGVKHRTPPPPPHPLPLPDPTSNSDDLAAQAAYNQKDYAEEMRLYRLAADRGDPIAQSQIGVMYSLGTGVPVDFAEAMRWYRLAAAQGLAAAHDNIGWLYSHGQGVPTDYVESMRWYRIAADQGDVVAVGWVGYFYDHGLGVTQSISEARVWYAKAAALGDTGAVTWLAQHPK